MTSTPTPTTLDLDALQRLCDGATGGEWVSGCFIDDSTKCNCQSVTCEAYAGAICTIHVDNGKRIDDGGNDCPPLEEAKANSRFIAASRTAFPALIAKCRELQAENERQQAALAEYATKNTHLMNDVVQMGMARDDYYDQLAAAQERIKELEDALVVEFEVIAYDDSGYGDNRSQRFAKAEEAIAYAQSLESRFHPSITKRTRMQTVSEPVPFAATKEQS